MRKKKKQGAARQNKAEWRPDGTSQAACSACGFHVEAARAVETGWTALDYVSVRYRYCPMCGARMSVPAVQGP